MATPTRGRAAIYCRVSTTLQATDEKTSLQQQERLCRERAAEDGLVVVEEYVVHDASSGSVDSVDRAALQRLLQAAERGAFDVVLMDLIDRTSRGGVFEFADICQRFLRFGVIPLWATDRDIDLTTPTGQLIAAVKSWAAYQEKEAIARRMRRGKQGRIVRGLLAREYCPYGYRWIDAEHTQYEPDPVTAPIVLRIYRDLVAGQSASAIARALNAAGVPTPSQVKGTPRTHRRFAQNAPRWTEPTMAYLVRNPVYKGERAQNRFESLPRDRQDRLDRNLTSARAHKQRDIEQWVITQVPALVDAQTWAAALTQLSRGNFRATKNPTRYTDAEVLLYGGYIRCAHCGRALSPRRRQPTPKKPTAHGWYYTCQRLSHLPSGERCIGTAINCDLLDAVVWSEAVRLIRDPHHLRKLLTRSEAVWSPETQLAHYTQLLAQVDQEDADIAHELLRLAGKPGLEHIRANLEQQAIRNADLRAGYQQRLAEAEAERQRLVTRAERITTFATWAVEQADGVEDLTATERRDTLTRVLHPTVFVGRVGSDLPRLAVFFAVTPEAAAQIDPDALYTTAQWQGEAGGVYTVFVDEWPTTGGTGMSDTLDLSTVEAAEPETFRKEGFSVL